jgi:hypothetical protein
MQPGWRDGAGATTTTTTTTTANDRRIELHGLNALGFSRSDALGPSLGLALDEGLRIGMEAGDGLHPAVGLPGGCGDGDLKIGGHVLLEDQIPEVEVLS